MKAVEVKDQSGNSVYVIPAHVTHVTRWRQQGEHSREWTEINFTGSPPVLTDESALALLKRLKLV